jgi:RimJ/RimL family protein N-acetyltransferase
MTAEAWTEIRKAQFLKGKTLLFRDANESDAELILTLRTNERKGKHLSSTSFDVESQRKWLRQYAVATDQAYFIIEHLKKPVGTVRLYDPRGNSFCWGSWIIADGQPAHVAIESALMVYAYALDHLGFEQAHFDVRVANEKVWKFHERFGAKRVRETNSDFFYELSLEAIKSSTERYKRFLPEGLDAKKITEAHRSE